MTQTEDDGDEIHRRLSSILKAADLDYADCHELYVRSTVGEGALLASKARDGTLVPSPLAAEIEGFASEIGAKLIVLDTLANLYPGHENDRAQVTQFVDIVKGIALRCDCAIVVLAYLKSWRATDNALESICAMHNSAALMLDELSQANPATAAQSAYMIANGKGKSRARKDGQARAALDWRLIFLSAGEVGLADKLREGGGQIAAGMEVRIVDIRADAEAGLGIFEDIHGSDSAGAFAQDLKRAAPGV